MDPLGLIALYKEHTALTVVGLLVSLVVGATAYFGIKIPSDQEYEFKSVAIVYHACSESPGVDNLPDVDKNSLHQSVKEDLVLFARYVKLPWMLGCIGLLVSGAILIAVLDERLRRSRTMQVRNNSLKEEVSLLRANILQLQLNQNIPPPLPRGHVFVPRNPKS